MTITLIELLSFAGVMLSVLVFAAGVVRNLWVKVIKNTEALGEFKLEVAHEYAGIQHLNLIKEDQRRSEERLNTSIVALTARIDRVLTRMEK